VVAAFVVGSGAPDAQVRQATKSVKQTVCHNHEKPQLYSGL